MNVDVISNEIIRENPYMRLNIFSRTYPPHSHTFFEFAIVLNSKCKHSMNGQPYEDLEKGSFVFIRPKDFHSFKFEDKLCTYRDFYVTEEKMKRICASMGPDFYDNLMAQKEFGKLSLTVDEFNFIESKAIFFSHPNLSKDKDSAKAELECIHTTIISLLLCKISESMIKNKHNQAPPWLENLFLRLTYMDFIHKSVKEIVEYVGFSHSYICNMFKKYYSTTLIAYHNKNKVLYSLNLLNTHKIIEIANELGWENPKNYAKEFKKVFGMSPKQYAMQNKALDIIK